MLLWAAMTDLQVSALVLILREDTGVAAIALLPPEGLICARNGWLAPLPSEGSTAIVHGAIARPRTRTEPGASGQRIWTPTASLTR